MPSFVPTTRELAACPSGISLRHLKALHVPVPPVHLDADGYLVEDGSALAQSEVQLPVIAYWHGALVAWYQARRRPVTILGDHLVLVDEGVKTAAVVPDVLVAFGVEPGQRRSYKVWREPKPPDFVLEVLSDTTWRTDVEDKPGLYEDLGVREYWTFDPLGLRRGHAAVAGMAFPHNGTGATLPEVAPGRWRSAVLGLDMVPEGGMLWLHDPETGERLPDMAAAVARYLEAERGREEAERGRIEERRARLAAEAELAKLRAVVQNPRGKTDI